MRLPPPGALALLSGLAFMAACAATMKVGAPIEGLERDQRDQFDRGRKGFERVFTPRTGLGPLFNETSCAGCHEDPVSGGSGEESELHVASFSRGGVCDPLIEKGGPVIQQKVTPELKAALGIDSEPVPAGATARATRSSPALFGLGLLDAVPDKEILALADPDDADGDGISGRPNRNYDGRLGRFGRKALVPTLDEFIAGAYVAEQGITNPSVPDEETIGGKPVPEGVDLVPDPEIDRKALEETIDFVRFLAPPPPQELTGAAKRGRKIFSQIRCDRCHVPVLKTGEHAVEGLRDREVAAYTDLLLHDMGPEMSDVCLGLASPSEFRTQPLMGLRLSHRFLHDGRAKTIEEAVRMHGGEASAARDRFNALPPDDRNGLLEFLKSL